jgi:hypothetical protein
LLIVRWLVASRSAARVRLSGCGLAGWRAGGLSAVGCPAFGRISDACPDSGQIPDSARDAPTARRARFVDGEWPDPRDERRRGARGMGGAMRAGNHLPEKLPCPCILFAATR